LETGLLAAQLLYTLLTEKGYRIHMDTKELIPGDDFTTVIHEWLKTTKKVLLLMTPGCFDRCVEPNDFFQFEIFSALELKCDIIPVNFYSKSSPPIPPKAPKQVKEAIQEVKQHLRIFFSAERVEDSLEKIIEAL
jgi:hypothetical protein